jgi:ABC-type transport system substrate-binding protein
MQNKSNIILLIFSVITLTSCSMLNRNKNINIGVPYEWGSLDVTERSTAVANSLLQNEFEQLLSFNNNGTLEPKVAKNWSISDDFKTYNFTINTDLKFSNGENITPQIIKDGWENALSKFEDPNKSALASLFSKVSGWDEFKKTKHLSGIKTSQEILTISFSESTPDALNNLSFGRYAAILNKDNKQFGTGPYYKLKTTKDFLVYKKNPYNLTLNLFDQITIKIISPSQANKALEENRLISKSRKNSSHKL